MEQIGSYGEVIFEVSNSKVMTFNNFQRNGDARWSTHDIILKKPIPEFIGPGQETLSLKIILNRSLGVNPETELNKLRKYRDEGDVYPFILGTKPITDGKWYIESVSESYKQIVGKGEAISVEADLVLKEYPNITTVTSTKKTTPAKTTTSPKSKTAIGTIKIKVNMLNCRATPSLKGKIVKVLRKNQKFKVYGTKKTDITWYDLGGGKYCSASSKYVTFTKG